MLFLSDEQHHLLQLLLSDQHTNVALGLQLLQTRSDQAFFVRALGLVVMANFYPEVVAIAKPYLEYHFPQEWINIQKELQWLKSDVLRQQTAAIIFGQTLRPYKAHAAFYETYMKLAPHYAFIYMPLAIIACNQARKPQAQYYLKRMMELDPNQPLYAYHYAAYALPQTPETIEERLRYLHRAAEAPNATIQYVLSLASFYIEQLQDLPQAIYWLQRTLDLQPNHHTALNTLAKLYTQQKDFIGAATIYEQLQAAYPRNSLVLAHYACFALYHQDDPHKALQLAQDAVRIQHSDPYPQAILALVYWYGFQDQRGMRQALQVLYQQNYESPLTRRLHRDLRELRTLLPPSPLDVDYNKPF